jgi:hypothetical protein
VFSIVHIHLAINHSPLYAEAFAFFFLLLGLVRRNRTLATSGLVIAIIAALCAIAATTTGDGASDFVRHASPPIAGVDTQAIGEHEDAADYFVVASCITGGLAIVALWMGRRRERPRWLEIAIVVLIAFSLSIVVRVALLGGRIHHPEVRAVIRG